MSIAAKIVRATCWSIPLLDSSTPPLNPIANSRYSENSLGMGAGISKSDLRKIASIPMKKANMGGFKIFDATKLKSTIVHSHFLRF
jgi:hypothetical protein